MSKVSVKWFIIVPLVVTGLFALVYAIILSNAGDFSLYDSLVDKSSMVNPSGLLTIKVRF